MQAMILAAGFGTRLRPYSTFRPKPLFPLLNVSLLRLVIEQLQAIGCRRILVNGHYLSKQIANEVGGLKGVSLQMEDEILGTGGGLREALSWIEDEPLLVVNGDIYHTVDLHELYRMHKKTGARVTLALHDQPRFNSIAVRDGKIAAFGSTSSESLAFTGIHVINPEVLEAIPQGEKSCIIERYRSLIIEDKDALFAYRVDGAAWTDMGTVVDYLDLHGGLLTKKISSWPSLKERVEKVVFIEEGALFPEETVINDWAAIGRAEIGRNVTIRRSVVWDGARIPDNAVVEDMIVA